MGLLFNETFRHEQIGSISKSIVERTVKRFEQTGIKNCVKSGRPATATISIKRWTFCCFLLKIRTILFAMSQHDIDLASAHETLKEINSTRIRSDSLEKKIHFAQENPEILNFKTILLFQIRQFLH